VAGDRHSHATRAPVPGLPDTALPTTLPPASTAQLLPSPSRAAPPAAHPRPPGLPASPLHPTKQVIMYDEPTAGLDPVASTVVEDLIRSLQSPQGTDPSGGGISSYIVVTHQHSTIRRAVDRIIFLHQGRVVWEGTTQEFDTTDEPIVRQFAEGSLEGPIAYL